MPSFLMCSLILGKKYAFFSNLSSHDQTAGVPQGFPRKELGINKCISALTRVIPCGAEGREGEGGDGPPGL